MTQSPGPNIAEHIREGKDPRTGRYDVTQIIEKDHGRLETRRHQTISDPEFMAFVDPKGKWAGLQCIGMVQAHRTLAIRAPRKPVVTSPPSLGGVCSDLGACFS